MDNIEISDDGIQHGSWVEFIGRGPMEMRESDGLHLNRLYETFFFVAYHGVGFGGPPAPPGCTDKLTTAACSATCALT